jgi:hypothetical protein
MISIKRIVEQYGVTGQYYDLGKDFANFRRVMDGTDEQIKQKYERAIGARLVGKRIRARASRGYKQYIKDYEFDVTRVTLDDYYDNYVVVAYDNATPKPKEYFLKPGFKIQIIGPATGQPSPQKGGKPEIKPKLTPQPLSPKQSPDAAQSQPMALAPAGDTPSEQPMKEGKSEGYYDAYSVDQIGQDIKPWLIHFLKKPETAMRDFIKGLGWMKDLGHGTSVAMFDIKIPTNALRSKLTLDILEQALAKITKEGTIRTRFNVVEMKPNETKDGWNIRIRKTMTDTKAI